jgi:hypothetical protein
MNRAQRRQVAHSKPIAPPRRRRIFGLTRPTLDEVRVCFAEIDHIFELLRAGEIDLHGDVPAFRAGETGEWFQLAPALHCWSDLWDKLATHYHIPINTTSVRRLVDQLHAGEMVTETEVRQAWATINIARDAYRQMDVYEVKSFVRTIMIKDRLDAAGLTGALQ